MNGAPISPRVIALPAVTNEHREPCEQERWLEAYQFTDMIELPGCRHPFRYTADGLGLFPTGVGKSHAAASIASLCSSSAVTLEETIFISAGIAGITPERGTIGSVGIANRVVDWDCKFRFDPREAEATSIMPSQRRDAVIPLEASLVEAARGASEAVTLATDEDVAALCSQYDEPAARGAPGVLTGSTVTSDEYWHGTAVAEDVETLLAELDAGRPATTQMEDFATATTLERFGHLDRYLSVRAASNFDRPPQNRSTTDIIAELEDSAALSLGLENAFRVGSAIAEAVLADEI